MGIKIGNIIIQTEGESNKQQEELKTYLATEIDKINKQTEAVTSIDALNRNTSSFINPMGIPFSDWAQNKKKDIYKTADLDTLKFWSDELPQSPQTIEYIVKSIFARGYKITLREGKIENKELLGRIKSFFREANDNETPFIEVLKTSLRNSLQVGNGYMEKLPAKGNPKVLAGVVNIKPWNIKVITDEAKEEQGILKILGYLKVASLQDKVDLTTKEAKANKLDVSEVIHIKYIDEGDKYGRSAFEKNQELTKIIINVMNRNSKKFTNDIRHSLLITLGKKATQIDADIFLAQYRANYLGKNNYGKPLIVFGDIKVERWDLEDKDFDYENFMIKLGMNHAPSLLNVAPSEVLNNDAKYSNASQGHITTVLNTIYDWQTRTEQIVNDQILRDIEGLGDEDSDFTDSTYEFDLERENLFTMYANLSSINESVMSGIMSPDEAREIIDDKNLPYIDEDWAKQYYVKLGRTISVINKEFFQGNDTAELSYNDGKDKLVSLQSYFKKSKK